MKRIALVIIISQLCVFAAQAQSELAQNLPLTRLDSFEAFLTPKESTEQKQGQILPDNPIPVQPSLQDGPAPCPSGNGKSCALLGGRSYFSDPVHMTQHDQTLGKAMRNPAMLVAFGLNIAATIADAEGTQACLHAGTCREANPTFGSNPSRARAYGTIVPIAVVAYTAFAMLKKQGRGNLAFGLLWADTVVHIYFASSGFSSAHVVGSTNTRTAKGQINTRAIRF